MEAGLAGCFVGAAPLLASPADRSEFCLDWCMGNAPQPPGDKQAVLGSLGLDSCCSQGGQSPGLLNTRGLGLCTG